LRKNQPDIVRTPPIINRGLGPRLEEKGQGLTALKEKEVQSGAPHTKKDKVAQDGRMAPVIMSGEKEELVAGKSEEGRRASGKNVVEREEQIGDHLKAEGGGL